MAKISEKLAEPLEVLKKLQDEGIIAIQTKQISRIHRERLLKNGFIRKVIRGWYISARPDEIDGESTSWYAAFWGFCSEYLNNRFADDWCLSPEQSIKLHVGNWTVPLQLLVRTPKGGNKPTIFLHGTSIFDVQTTMPEEKSVKKKDGLRIYSLSASLINSSPNYFSQNATDMRAALSMIRDASEVLNQLLEGGHSTKAGRLAGAFRNIGRNNIADDILKTMRAAGYQIRETDPFEESSPVYFSEREVSPYVNRIKLMWEQMKISVVKSFPDGKPGAINAKDYLKELEDIYVTDAYHSLSIEGYSVSRELIEKIRTGDWDPDGSETDQEHKNALAARGYWQAFQLVKQSIEKVLNGQNPGEIVENEHGDWYREMFAPGVAAGILKAGDLAGYRNQSVHIRGSMHSPPSHEAVRELMPAFFELLKNEESSATKMILGHFIFVYIHPYIDGNGRIGRFLMNVMRAAQGCPWLVIPVEERSNYMSALEEASVNQNIVPFAKFLARI